VEVRHAANGEEQRADGCGQPRGNGLAELALRRGGCAAGALPRRSQSGGEHALRPVDEKGGGLQMIYFDLGKMLAISGLFVSVLFVLGVMLGEG